MPSPIAHELPDAAERVAPAAGCGGGREHGPPDAQLDIEREVAGDKIRMLHREATHSLAGSLLAGVLWVCAVWGTASHGLLVSWLAIFALAMLSRLALVLHYRRRTADSGAMTAWFRGYALTVLVSSLMWGLGAPLLMLGAPLLQVLVTFAFLVGLAGASLVAYGLFPRLTLLVIGLLLLPVELVLFFSGDSVARWASLAGVLFALSTTRSVYAYGARMEESVRQTHGLREANRIAQWHAETDVLTGLDNRRAFTGAARALMQLAAREKSGVAMLVIDLDHFKDINDGYGHSVGDALLAHVADLMRTALRRSDICGRLGGDEFAVLLPNATPEAAHAVAEKIRTLALQTTVPLDGLEVSVCLSIGIACGAGEDFDALLARADHAMYEAKRMGPNRIVAAPAT
jgi:diguanylate cyclase (GGDEF)-like protein